MKKRAYLFLIAAVFALLSFPQNKINAIRSFAINAIAPSGTKVDEESLALENYQLKQELDQFKSWLLTEFQVQNSLMAVSEYEKKQEDPFYERRLLYLASLIEKQRSSLRAKVVFREPTSWSTTLWINVGERDNRNLGREIVAKNSPVVVGRCVVGVVETVLEKRSSVRLITDSNLTPSVRVVRGSEQNRGIDQQIEMLVGTLKLREDLENADNLCRVLEAFREGLDLQEKDLYLAKGEIHGGSAPLWRVHGQTLVGTGFNYDFSDEEGPARSLREDSLIRIGDLLVTSGMDGVFPKDLHVGIVSKISPLKEGECSYSLQAKSLLPNLSSLSEVEVLPPL